jgi:hypothetical protein
VPSALKVTLEVRLRCAVSIAEAAHPSWDRFMILVRKLGRFIFMQLLFSSHAFSLERFYVLLVPSASEVASEDRLRCAINMADGAHPS